MARIPGRPNDLRERNITAMEKVATMDSVTFVHLGEYWTLSFRGQSFALKDIKGLSYIRRLVQNPNQEFYSIDLISGGIGVSTAIDDQDSEFFESTSMGLGDSGVMLDQQAVKSYRNRLSELRQELDELRERGDLERASRTEDEVEFLTRELARALGLYGRNRRAGSAAERARLNVTRAIRASIEKISGHDASLGALLGRTIKTGAFCSYVPGLKDLLSWRFSLDNSEPVSESPDNGPLLSARQTISRESDEGRTTFVGREQERSVLRLFLARVLRGERKVIMLNGPPGVGKTRLANESRLEASRNGFVTLGGSCYERGDAIPYGPFIQILEASLALAPNSNFLRDALGDEAAQIAILLPQLHRVFSDIPAPPEVAPGLSRRILHDAVVNVLARLSADKPLLVVIDDLHWGDEGTFSLLAHLAESRLWTSMMIVGTYRDIEWNPAGPLAVSLDELVRMHMLETITLRGLPREAVGEMIHSLSGQDPPDKIITFIYSGTEGNPFFVEELFRHLSDGGELIDESGLFRDQSIAELNLPATVRVSIDRRLARITEQTREILGIAAVLGRSFTFSLLEAVSNADPDALISVMDHTERAGFLTSNIEYPEAKYQFSHELIRQAVIAGLSAPRRQRLHLRIAEAIERVYAPNPEDRAEDLAHHLWNAGSSAETAKTIRYSQIAGDKAARASANTEAISHFKRALELIHALPETSTGLQQELLIQTALGTALIATKGFSSSEVEKVYARARELSQQVGEAEHLFLVLFGLWLSHASRGEYSTALDLAEQCFRLAEDTAELGLRLQAHHALGVSFLSFGDLAQALEHLNHSITLYDPKQHSSYAHIYGHDPAVVCLMHASWTLWLLGYPDQALKKGNASLLMARTLAEASTSATAAAFVACLQQMCGNVDAVEELSMTAIQLSTEHHFEYYKAMGVILHGWVSVKRGSTARGIEQMRSGLDAFRSVGGVLLSSYFSGLLAEVYMAAGSIRESADLLDKTDSDLEPWWAAELHRLKGELALQNSHQKSSRNAKEIQAAESFNHALAIARSQNAKSLELRTATGLCRLWIRQGKSNEARDLLGAVLSSFTEGFATPDLATAKILFDRL